VSDAIVPIVPPCQKCKAVPLTLTKAGQFFTYCNCTDGPLCATQEEARAGWRNWNRRDGFKTQLNAARMERDELAKRLDDVTSFRFGLSKQVADLTKERDELQQQLANDVASWAKERYDLCNRIDSLVKERDELRLNYGEALHKLAAMWPPFGSATVSLKETPRIVAAVFLPEGWEQIVGRWQNDMDAWTAKHDLPPILVLPEGAKLQLTHSPAQTAAE